MVFVKKKPHKLKKRKLTHSNQIKMIKIYTIYIYAKTYIYIYIILWYLICDFWTFVVLMVEIKELTGTYVSIV